MRRLIAPFIALTVACGVALSPGCSKSPSGPSTASQVVAFGDSLTFGIGTTGDNDYVAVLSQRVGVDIHISSVPGETTGSALNRLVATVLARSP